MTKISEVIAYLEGVKRIHGDMPVFTFEGTGIDIETEIDLEKCLVVGEDEPAHWEVREHAGSSGNMRIPDMPKRVIL